MMRTVNVTGDWHIRTESDAQRIDQMLPKHGAFIFAGDLIDTGIDRGMQWNQDNVDLQVAYLQDIIEGRRILGYVLGNHEDRIVNITGLNPYRAFLGEPTNTYFFKAPVDKIHMSQIHVLSIEHGSKSVKNPLTQLKDLATIHPRSDIVALGHDHTLGIWRDKQQWLVRTGHLQPYPEYAQKAILQPKPMGYIRISLKTGKPEVILV